LVGQAATVHHNTILMMNRRTAEAVEIVAETQAAKVVARDGPDGMAGAAESTVVIIMLAVLRRHQCRGLRMSEHKWGGEMNLEMAG